jgi:uroporphyrinogen decarboxylase
MLTPHENFQRMMSGAEPERIPYDVSLTPPVRDRLEAETGTRDPVEGLQTDFESLYSVLEGGGREEWLEAYASLGVQVPANASVSREGILRVSPTSGTGEAYHFKQLVHGLASIESVRELEELPWPSLTTASRSHFEDTLAKARAGGRTVIASCECTLFEHAWYLRGMDQLFYDLMDENPVGEWLLDWFMERSIRDMKTFCAIEEVEVIGLGDDIGMQTGMMMSVPFWREHLKPRLANVIRAIRGLRGDTVLVRYHSDGDIRDVIPDLIEIGVDILNPVQPECMDVAEILRKYREKCAFWGMIGTQSTLPHGNPGDVQRVIHQLLDLARQGVRLVAAPTHVLEPDVPWENIRAMDEIRRLRI